MKKTINEAVVFLVMLILPTITLCQPIEQNKLEFIAREIIDASGNCALITIDDEGQPRARTMDPFAPEDDFTIWFGTNTKSRKVKQIKNEPRVTLYYFDKPSSSYVTIHGKAQIIDDAKEKMKFWKNNWSAFYPSFPQGYTLIKVTPEWMEIISESRGVTDDSITWQPPILRLDSLK
jgi:general stress protein 26